MKVYNINVNGKTYEVEVEEVGAVESTVVRTQAPVAKAPAVAQAPKPQPKPQAKPASGAAGAITSPMPGTILDIKVTEGQSVKNGDIILILEAMKMENEIFASSDGVVKSINVQKGSSVNSGDELVVIE